MDDIRSANCSTRNGDGPIVRSVFFGNSSISAGDQSPIGSPFGPKSEPGGASGIDLIDRKAIVTGGYSGIGIKTLRVLTAAGAEVTVPARTLDKANKALAGIEGITAASMDLGYIRSVRTLAEDWSSRNAGLDLLINTAATPSVHGGSAGRRGGVYDQCNDMAGQKNDEVKRKQA